MLGENQDTEDQVLVQHRTVATFQTPIIIFQLVEICYSFETLEKQKKKLHKSAIYWLKKTISRFQALCNGRNFSFLCVSSA